MLLMMLYSFMRALPSYRVCYNNSKIIPRSVSYYMIDFQTCVYFKARGGGGRGVKNAPILIFQYVVELEKTNKMQKTGG